MDLRQSISNQNDVSLIIAKHLISSEAKDKNLVFSPLSIHVVLGLLAAGSKGLTQEQLLSFLKSNSIDDLNSLCSQLVTVVFADGSPSGGPLLSFANGVWIDQSLSFKPSFQNIVHDIYKAVSNQVDFVNRPNEVTNEVNSWAERGTNGLINEILPSGSVDRLTRLIFANALYYKGAWNKKFDASETQEHEFHLLNGSSVQAPFMTSNKKQYISAFDGFKVLSLHYKQGEDKRHFSMYFFLPDAKDGLPALVDRFGTEPRFLENHLRYMEEVQVGDFRIPKFKISFGFEASKLLEELGIVLPFTGEGLTEMVDPSVEDLYVSSIFHKSFIEVNEEGTEAAAATAGVMSVRSLEFLEELDFVADHPFLFLIREDITGVVLFIGSVLNPVLS